MKLEELTSVLSSEEQKSFVIYLSKLNKRSDTKNIELFQLIVGGASSQDIPSKLYGVDNKRAYHALRIRLQKNIVNYLGQDGLKEEASEEVEIYKLVFLGRKFLQKQHYKIGSEFLLLAKEKAITVQHYVLLNEIYHSMIQYSYTCGIIDLKKTIELHASNTRYLIQEEKLNIVYALIQNKLTGQLYDRGEDIPIDLVSNLIKEYNVDINSFNTFKSLFQYTKILLAVAQAKNDYYGFIHDIIERYQRIAQMKEESDRQLFYQVRLLYSISNTCFRVKDFEKCKAFLTLLSPCINNSKFSYKERFQYKFVMLKALCDNYSGNNLRAIHLIESINLNQIENYKDRYDLLACHILFLIHAGNLDGAKKVLSTLFHTDNYYEERMGMDWLLKLRLIEIILFFDLGEDDLVVSRLRSYKRSLLPYLEAQKQHRVIRFVKLIEKMFNDSTLTITKEFETMVDKSIVNPTKQEDIFVQSFYGWMKARMLKRNVYEVTLELVKL